MRPITRLTPALAAACVAAGAAAADTVTMNPVADAFVSSAQPNGNFGAAGALSVAASGLPQGEFQTLIRFDTAPAVAAFNATYGAGNWVITNISLTLTSASPNNPIFNAAAPGVLALRWMQNDSWVEGAGGPSAPSPTGINFNTLPSFLSPGDEALGNFNYTGATTGTVQCSPLSAPGLIGDAGLGGLVSFRLSAADTAVSWVFNSRSFGTVASRPVLSVTAIPAPGTAALLAALLIAPARRRSR